MGEQERRGVAVITGVGRRRSIGSALALGLAADGWDLALSYWHPYDERVGMERNASDPEALAVECRDLGATVELIPGDLSRPETPAELLQAPGRSDR